MKHASSFLRKYLGFFDHYINWNLWVKQNQEQAIDTSQPTWFSWLLINHHTHILNIAVTQ